MDGQLVVPYTMWCLRRGAEVIVVETGLSEPAAARRGLVGQVVAPAEALSRIGVDAARVTQVIVTHMHGDHFSAWDAYPNATFTLQNDDLAFFSGRFGKYPCLVQYGTDMAPVMHLNSAGRLNVIEGDGEFTTGIELILTGGHTPGSQIVKIHTSGGDMVLCGDEVELYESLGQYEPTPHATSRLNNVLAFDRIVEIAGDDRGKLWPGHDIGMLRDELLVADSVYRIA
jgi:glyoxylase-like metal-dependent hydrolase (beta-lactamase superfamily II)